MVMVGVVSGSLQADSQPGSFGLVWGSAAAWRRAIFITWTGWTLAVALSFDDSTINIVVGIIIIIIKRKCKLALIQCSDWPLFLLQAQLPLRNRASAMHFFVAKLFSITVMTYVYHLQNLCPMIRLICYTWRHTANKLQHATATCAHDTWCHCRLMSPF